MTNPQFIMLVGLPGSGKSTFRARPAYADWVQLSSDDLIEQDARVLGVTYDEAFSVSIKGAAGRLQERLTTALKARQNVIWDQTNLTAKKRRGILSQLPKHYHKTAVYFEIDEGLRQQRLADRFGKTIPYEIDINMRKSLVVPAFEEGFDTIIFSNGQEALAA